jgi:hypothetical protein
MMTMVGRVGFEPTYARIKNPPFNLLNYRPVIWKVVDALGLEPRTIRLRVERYYQLS